MTFDAGDVVVVPFPFTGRATVKRRPALVLSNARFHDAHGHLVLAMITSARHSQWPSDIPISDLGGVGLRAPSVVRFKVFTLTAEAVQAHVGTLSARDRDAIRHALRGWFL